MKKLIICLFILVFLTSVLPAVVTDKKSETLSLVLPADTLTISLSWDGTTPLYEDARNITLWKYSTDFSANGDTPVSTSSSDTSAASTSDKVYAYSALEFYVLWEALVSAGTRLAVTVPEYFYGTSSDDKLKVMSRESLNASALGELNNNMFVLEPGTDYTLQQYETENWTDIEFDSDKIYSGSQSCILILDIKDAKLESTYSGEIEFKVVTT